MIKQLTIGGHYSIPIILEGGSIHTDGEGTLLTTEECLCNPNRNPQLQRHQIEQILQLCLHIEKVIWLPTGLDADDDTNGHIDNFCCFVRPGHVVLAWTDDDVHDVENYQRCRQAEQVLVSAKDAKGRSFTITKLYLPSPPLRYTEEEALSLAIKSTEEEQGGPNDRTVHTDDDKKTKYIMIREPNEKMAASYVNFYIANEAVLVPQFGKDAVITDRQACETLQGVFPDRKVVGVPSREILLGGGNIHCQTQQVPALK
jgi:agmatine deiminase